MSRQDLAMEQKVLRGLKLLPKPPRRLLLALSGGADSMVMAEILYKWRKGLKLELAVAHVHHGRSGSKKQNDYRKRTRKFVSAWAAARDLKFYSNTSAPSLKSEQEMRDFREACLREWSGRQRSEAIAFAHHQDDLLETRLIRLIRGSGTQGMEAMCVHRRQKLRPLLTLSAQEIRAYAKACELNWIEDPSNEKSDILRNWLRHEWLPSLENQRPGAVKSLARSLQIVSPKPQEFDLAPYVGLRREHFNTGPTQKARELLAQYLKALGLKGYAQTHVDEILKRVSSRQKNLSFDMLGLKFQVSSDFLWASRV